eukprot:2328146-Heterocapsa_arctica.AAC.1
MARALEIILTRLFSLTLSQYVDDYPQIEPRGSTRSDACAVEQVLALLGWGLKRKDDKVPDFDVRFTALG